MLFSIDRIEGTVAVLVDEEGNSHPVPLSDLPTDVRAGMMLRKECKGYVLATEEQELRRRQVLELQRRLRKQ